MPMIEYDSQKGHLYLYLLTDNGAWRDVREAFRVKHCHYGVKVIDANDALAGSSRSVRCNFRRFHSVTQHDREH